jgi:ketosteroid isomerase-like protein
MYRLIVRAMARRQFGHLSAGRLDEFMSVFDAHSVFRFAGDHAFGGELHGTAEIRPVIERMRQAFPDLAVVPKRILVQGWPWNTIVATQLEVRATLPDGTPYQNDGLQLLRLRWGKVAEDRVYEDTDKLHSALATLSVA